MKLEAAITGFGRQQAADGRSGHTRAAYRRDLGALAGWLGTDVDVQRITPDTLARFLVSDAVLLTPSGSPRKPITVNRTKSALRSFFGFCVDSGWIKETPARLGPWPIQLRFAALCRKAGIPPPPAGKPTVHQSTPSPLVVDARGEPRGCTTRPANGAWSSGRWDFGTSRQRRSTPR